jgi:hypothetical protein
MFLTLEGPCGHHNRSTISRSDVAPAPKGGQRSYSEIAAELFALGHADSNDVPFSKSSIKSMLEG